MHLSPSVSPKFIATSLLSGLTLKSVPFWDCLVLQKFPLVTWNPWLGSLQPGCRLTSSLTSFLTSPVLLPLHIWIHSFIHPSIHSKDAYRQDAYPHTAMDWGGEITSFQRVPNLIEEQEPQMMRTTSLTLGTSPPAPDHTLWHFQFPFLGLIIASNQWDLVARLQN